MFITGPLLITAPMLLKRQPCINNYIIIIIIIKIYNMLPIELRKNESCEQFQELLKKPLLVHLELVDNHYVTAWLQSNRNILGFFLLFLHFFVGMYTLLKDSLYNYYYNFYDY